MKAPVYIPAPQGGYECWPVPKDFVIVHDHGAGNKHHIVRIDKGYWATSAICGCTTQRVWAEPSSPDLIAEIPNLLKGYLCPKCLELLLEQLPFTEEPDEEMEQWS